MIKIELYKDGDLVLSSDGKIDDRLLVFGNIIYDEVTSTNDILLKENFAYGSVITASSQTKGRGRN